MKVAVAFCSEHQITKQFSPLSFLVIPSDFPNQFSPSFFSLFFLFFFLQTPSHTFGHRQWDLPPFFILPRCKCVHDKLISAYLTEPGFLQGWEWEQELFGKGFISFFDTSFLSGGIVKWNLIFKDKRGRKKGVEKPSGGAPIESEIMEFLRLEKPSKIINSNHQPPPCSPWIHVLKCHIHTWVLSTSRDGDSTPLLGGLYLFHKEIFPKI